MDARLNYVTGPTVPRTLRNSMSVGKARKESPLPAATVARQPAGSDQPGRFQ